VCVLSKFITQRWAGLGKREKWESQVRKNVNEQRGKQSKAKRQKMYFIQCAESREAQFVQAASQPVKWQVLWDLGADCPSTIPPLNSGYGHEYTGSCSPCCCCDFGRTVNAPWECTHMLPVSGSWFPDPRSPATSFLFPLPNPDYYSWIPAAARAWHWQLGSCCPSSMATDFASHQIPRDGDTSAQGEIITI